MALLRNTLLLLCVGCGGNAPFWALDQAFLSPTPDGVTGTITWNIYGEQWKKKFNEKHYVCSVVVRFDAAPSATDCDECVVAFDLQTERTDSDCAEALASDPLFLSTRRLGIGALGDGPYDRASSVAWVDYGGGWEAYGWAYPEAVANDQPAASFTWDGAEPFSFSPTSAWTLQATSTTAQSRSALPTPSYIE